jgi:hypothetical protein
MKLKFLHDSMRFNRETAKEETIKKGQTVDIPDEDAGAFLSGTNPRAEIVSAKEKASFEEAQKPEPVAEVKPEPKAQKKAQPRVTKKKK